MDCVSDLHDPPILSLHLISADADDLFKAQALLRKPYVPGSPG
jgi:hypothetical protein